MVMQRPSSAFTLIELLTVLAIIAVLSGLLLAGGNTILSRRQQNSTKTLIRAVVTAIDIYQQRQRGWNVRGQIGGTFRDVAYPDLWDLNQSAPTDKPGDGFIDGRPAITVDSSHDGPFWSGLIDSGYRGFAAMAMPDLPARNRNDRDQPIDAWGGPLRIAFEGVNAGPGGVRVWSLGPDGVDGTADDVRIEGP